jgi:4-nitrophenyl phosphatase
LIDFALIQGVILDMDGVVWRGNQVLNGVFSFTRFLSYKHTPYVFATNNSTRTPDDYAQKLQSIGIPVTPAQVITSATATARYLHEHYPDFSSVFIVGQEGLRQALQAQGFREATGQAQIVVVGLDPELTYDKLRKATFQLNGGAVFIGTNADAGFPEPDGIAPGAGSILAALQTASGRQPKVIGKPEEPMFEHALAVLGTRPATTLMIGDRLETDIVGARQAGLRSALVLSGVSGEADLARSDIQPDGVFADLAALLKTWESAE